MDDDRNVDILSETDSEEEAYPVGSSSKSPAGRRKCDIGASRAVVRILMLTLSSRLRPYSDVDDPLEAYTERERKKAWASRSLTPRAMSPLTCSFVATSARQVQQGLERFTRNTTERFRQS